MANGYDVVVVGGGHNGLVAATELAKAGRRVLLLERRAILGGAAATEEFHPGFRASAATLCGLFRHELIDDLQLLRHGLSFIPCDPSVVVLGEEGRSLTLWRDERKAQASIATFSAADAAAYAKFHTLAIQIAGVLDPLLLTIPPSVESPALGDEWFLLRRALRLRRLGKSVMYEALRLPFMSLHAVLEEWFETEMLKASLALDGLLGVCRGPWSPYTAFGLIHRYLAETNGGSWSFVRGGTGALSNALASAAREAGVAIRTAAEVRRIQAPEGAVVGIELASGETIPTRAVVSTADPKTTFLKLVDPVDLGADFLGKVRNYSSDGCVAVIHLALDGAPRVGGVAEGNFVPPRFQIVPSQEYIERAYDDAKHGGASKSPTLDVTVPTAVDPSLAPPGKHVMSILAQFAPYRLKRGKWEDRRKDLGERVLEILEAHVTNLRSLVLAMEVLTPADLETRYGLAGGHIFHGEMTLNQMYVLRPVAGWGRYRTPIRGLYLGGSGSHPGGGLTGAPGHNGARALLEDWPGLARGA